MRQTSGQWSNRRSAGTRAAAVALGVLLLTSACSDGQSGEPATPDGGVVVVATTTILGDVARNVVGDGGTVDVLLPIGVDPHDYQASARQIARLQEADLVLANGLLLEEGLTDVLESVAADGANVVEIAELLAPIPYASSTTADAGGAAGHGDDGDLDPHVWLDPLRMAEAARLIAAELAAVDPAGDWAVRADSYAAELTTLDGEIIDILSAVPEEARTLITNHEALGYFAERYGFAVIGTVIPGGATLGDPSSAELAAIVDVIVAQDVQAIFAETTEPSALAEAIADEVDNDVEVVRLYTGSLGEAGSGADTLIGMLLTNARLVAEALS